MPTAARWRRKRLARRGDAANVQPRDPQACSDWGYVLTRQLARLPMVGRLRYVVDETDGDGVRVLRDEGKGDAA